MATGLTSWSKTAASNATADSSVGMAEGMAPSAVNDGIRALMASAAMWRDDNNGSLTTGGTSTAYTLSSNQSFASLAAMGNATFTFVPHTTNGDAPTLAVDGLTAKKIRFVTGTDIPSNSLIAGTPYTVTYFASVGEFVLHNLAANPYAIPLCGGLDYWGTATPNSAFVFPYGQAVSRTTYATSFALMGTTHGAGDGLTTFNLPDKRGRASVGKDDMGGSSANRLTNQSGGLNGDALGATGGAETHTLSQTEIAAHQHTGTTGTVSSFHSHTETTPSLGIQGVAGGSGYFMVSGISSVATGNESNNHTHPFTSDATGGGGAHNNVQPSIVCNYILRII
jgi:microcystin-dependent protein